jgi:site-specific recombinase XerD
MARTRRYEAADFRSKDPLIDEFADSLVREGQQPRTIVAYQRDLEHLGSFLASGKNDDPAEHREPPYDRLEKASATDLIGYTRWLQGSRRYAHRSIRRKVSCLRKFYRFVRFSGRRADNPASDIPVPKLGRRELTGVLDVDEVRRVLTMAPPAGLDAAQIARDRAILECLYSSGLRRSELVGLNEADVNLQRRSMRVLGKGNKVRYVPLTTHAAEAMRRYADLRPPSPTGAFFTGRAKARISESQVYKVVRTYMLLAGISDENAHPHILRHSVATHMRERGADVLFLREFLGHASTATTEIYTHLSAELIRSEFEETHARSTMDESTAAPFRRRRERRA